MHTLTFLNAKAELTLTAEQIEAAMAATTRLNHEAKVNERGHLVVDLDTEEQALAFEAKLGMPKSWWDCSEIQHARQHLGLGPDDREPTFAEISAAHGWAPEVAQFGLDWDLI